MYTYMRKGKWLFPHELADNHVYNNLILLLLSNMANSREKYVILALN